MAHRFEPECWDSDDVEHYIDKKRQETSEEIKKVLDCKKE